MTRRGLKMYAERSDNRSKCWMWGTHSDDYEQYYDLECQHEGTGFLRNVGEHSTSSTLRSKWFTNLTPCSRVLSAKMMVTPLWNSPPWIEPDGSLRYTGLTTTSQWTLSWARWIQTLTPYSFKVYFWPTFLILKKKIKGGLWDHLAVCVSPLIWGDNEITLQSACLCIPLHCFSFLWGSCCRRLVLPRISCNIILQPPGQVVWDSWWTRSTGAGFPPECFSFPCQFSFDQQLDIH
jgi:hypothetical protein